MQLPSYLDPFLDPKSNLPISFSPGSCFGISNVKSHPNTNGFFLGKKKKNLLYIKGS